MELYTCTYSTCGNPLAHLCNAVVLQGVSDQTVYPEKNKPYSDHNWGVTEFLDVFKVEHVLRAC